MNKVEASQDISSLYKKFSHVHGRGESKLPLKQEFLDQEGIQLLEQFQKYQIGHDGN